MEEKSTTVHPLAFYRCPEMQGDCAWPHLTSGHPLDATRGHVWLCPEGMGIPGKELPRGAEAWLQPQPLFFIITAIESCWKQIRTALTLSPVPFRGLPRLPGLSSSELGCLERLLTHLPLSCPSYHCLDLRKEEGSKGLQHQTHSSPWLSPFRPLLFCFSLPF